ncbi:hypothetical protein LPB144_04925 [Christiangramia salexigens]|uniref:HTH LytTR-type domain-containing protein n=2 Tax=Christiangramia salexigens TaxID=1913577 RepID=A0A1L3J8C7_9FLAO|nr:hypothetical protein LPB144_04925 [Christiangramia salexigens]
MASAAKLSLQLIDIGYTITGIFSRPKEAISFLEQDIPDYILIENRLKNKFSKQNISQICSAAILYFDTEHIDPVNLFGELRTGPKKDILKFKNELQKTYKKLLRRARKDKNNIPPPYLNDRVFVRHGNRMVRISLSDIHFIEANRNYCKVFTGDKQFILVGTLKDMEEKLKEQVFLRIHRSYIVNLAHIDEIACDHVVICKRSLPLAKNMRSKLFAHLQVI